MLKQQLKNKVLWGLFLLCLIFCLFPIHVQAAKQLPEGLVIGDDKGIHVESDGEYLMEINDILPGEKFETTISILNIDEKGQPFELFFWIDPPVQVEGPINFAEAMTMNLTFDEKTFFEGKVSGIGNIDLQKTEYSLGIFRPGDSRALKVFMEMDKNYTAKDYETRSVTENVWHFRAIRKDVPTESTDDSGEPTNPTNPGGAGGGGNGGGTDGKKPLIRLPQTGEEWRDALIYSCIGMFFIVVAILLWHHYHQKRKNEHKKGDTNQ